MDMSLDIREEALTLAALAEHAAIPIAFAVDRILEVRLLDGGIPASHPRCSCCGGRHWHRVERNPADLI